MRSLFNSLLLSLLIFLSVTPIAKADEVTKSGGSGDESAVPLASLARKWAYFEPYLRASYTKWSIHGGLGLAAYNGELSAPWQLKMQRYHLNPQVSVGVSYRWTNYISFRLESSFFKLYSESRDEQWAERPFVSRNLEWNLTLVHDLFPKTDVEFYAQRWNPYGFVGIGQLYFSPRNVENGDPLRPQRNNFDYEYAKIAAVFPMGLGINYYIRDYFSLGFEASYRFTTTDFLDDAKIKEDPNPVNDSYLFYGLKVNYQFIYLTKYKYRNHIKTGW